MKPSNAAVKSYWHAYLAIATAYVLPYLEALLTSKHPKFNFYLFAWGLAGALAAPLTRALVAKWPWLSPLALRITTKIAQEANLATPTPATVSLSGGLVDTQPASTLTVSAPVESVEQPVVPA